MRDWFSFLRGSGEHQRVDLLAEASVLECQPETGPLSGPAFELQTAICQMTAFPR